MNKETVFAFLKAIGASNLQQNGDWINCSCPLAKYTHQHMQDNKPSFGVVITSDGTPIYRCFSCTPRAEALENIISRIHRLSGKYPKQAARIFVDDRMQSEKEISVPLIDMPNFNVGKPKLVKYVPDDLLDKYFPLLFSSLTDRANNIKDYLLSRGIGIRPIAYFDLRYWAKFTAHVAFPMTLPSGKVTGLNIRNIKEKINFYATGKSFDKPSMKLSGAKTTGAWFGLSNIDVKKPVVLVEGAMDAMRLYELGITNVLASGGTSITDKQISKIPGLYVTIALDSDDAGRIAAKELYRRMKDKFIVSVVDWAFVGRKDPGELRNKKELHAAMNAKTSKPRND